MARTRYDRSSGFHTTCHSLNRLVTRGQLNEATAIARLIVSMNTRSTAQIRRALTPQAWHFVATHDVLGAYL